MKYEWEEEIRKSLGTPPEQPVVEATPASPPAKKTDSGWLVVLIFTLMLSLGGCLYWKDPTIFGLIKTRGVEGEAAPAPPAESHLPMDLTGDIRAIRDDLGKLKSGQDKLGADIDTLQKRSKAQGERIIMMGTVLNDNCEGQKRGDRDPLYLNHDWTIPREPRYLKFVKPEDTEFIRRHVRPPNSP